MDPKRLAWPNGARIAVLTTVLLKSWSPGKGPGYFPRTSTLPPGSIDHGAVQWGEFGGKEGIWRLARAGLPADLLVQHGIHWHAGALDTSLPRRQDTASGALVAFPWSDFVDNRVLRARRRTRRAHI